MKLVGKKSVMAAGSTAVLFLIALSAVAAQARGFEDLTLQIRCENDTIFPMEPVRLRVTLSNGTLQPILAHEHLDPGIGSLKFYVAGATGQFHLTASGSDLAISVGGHRKVLPPGYERSEQVNMWHGKTANSPFKLPFPLPGKYLLKAGLTSIDGKSKIDSNVVKVSVMEPEVRDEAAWEYLKKHELKNECFFFNAAGDPRRMVPIDDFVGRFPDSRYAVYGHYALGVSYYTNKDLDKARAHLEKVAEKKGFFFGDKVLHYLMRISLRKAAAEEARARGHFSTLKADYPSSARLEIAERDMHRATRQ
jgi:hypothetical protein